MLGQNLDLKVMHLQTVEMFMLASIDLCGY